MEDVKKKECKNCEYEIGIMNIHYCKDCEQDLTAKECADGKGICSLCAWLIKH